MKTLKTVAAASALVLLAACTQKTDWKIDGTVADAHAGQTVYLQEATNGKWITVDSATVGTQGDFSFAGTRPAFPDVYRLSMNGDAAYFPVDSLESITFVSETTLSEGKIGGSHSADMMQRINDIIAAATGGITEDTKREIAAVMSENLAGIASYYAINKVIGSEPLFNPTFSFDKRIIGGVATQFITVWPDDPRSTLLKDTALANQRLYSQNPSKNVIEAEEIPFVEIALRNPAGETESLTDTWKTSKATIINFTALTAEGAPALNIVLNRLFEKYGPKGLRIYQIGCDEDEFAWETAAAQLPWTAVYCSPVHNTSTLLNYNVGGLPTTYIVSHDGNRMERITDPAQLEKAVSQMLQ